LTPPWSQVISLQVMRQSSFTLAATAATMSAVFLVFLGVEMALIVSGFTSFYHHNDKVN
jgi:hypothetical protein